MYAQVARLAYTFPQEELEDKKKPYAENAPDE